MSTARGQISELFDQEFLKRLESLSVVARQLARGPQRAERQSTHRGASPEFAEYRAYVPGDDSRNIDWKAYARWHQLVLKLFVEEHDLPIYLLLDCTQSMDWGEPNKFDHARQTAAGLAYIGLGNHDRVGIVPLGNRANHTFPANRGKDRFWQMLQLLDDYTVFRGRSPLEEQMRRWLTFKPRRGMALWISDLWGETPEDALHALDRLRYSRHEIGVIQIMDAQEGEAGELGEHLLESVETGRTVPVLVNQKLQREYRQRYENYQRSVRHYCRRHSIPLLQMDTRTPVPDLLMKVLQEKGFVQ